MTTYQNDIAVAHVHVQDDQMKAEEGEKIPAAKTIANNRAKQREQLTPAEQKTTTTKRKCKMKYCSCHIKSHISMIDS